jgi:hypothetical protein
MAAEREDSRPQSPYIQTTFAPFSKKNNLTLGFLASFMMDDITLSPKLDSGHRGRSPIAGFHLIIVAYRRLSDGSE